MSKKKLQLLALGAGVLALFAWVVITQGPLSPVKVTVEKIQTGNLVNSVFGVGTIKAKRSYNLAPTMTGRIKSVLVEQGDRVVAGQVLAEMDPVDLEDKLASGQRVIEKAANSIRAAEAQVSEASSKLNTISATFVRYQELRTRGFVSQEMFDAKQHDKNAATAALATATASLNSAKEEQARAQADARGITKLNAQTRLLSPINGVVSSRLLEPGSTALGGQVVLQVIDPDSLWVETRIAQKQAGQIRVGQSAEIVLRSQAQTRLSGKVARIDILSDAVTEERIVNVSLEAVQYAASIGEYAEVTIKMTELNNIQTIASAAVKRVDKQEGVWVLRDGDILFKAVKTGVITAQGRTQILQGLSTDDEVIVFSQQMLRPGLKVKVVSELVKG
ncbi:MAG: efflux RND transporter periplasmic adaptor subunit [Gallionellaceae bacterium]|nr:efflux RND transporter periplasmic adaptor subunit [Gallionellaceae bacterium]